MSDRSITPDTVRKSLGQIAYEAYTGPHADWYRQFNSEREDWEDAAEAVKSEVLAALPPPAPAPTWEMVERLETRLAQAGNHLDRSHSWDEDEVVNAISAIGAALAEIARARGQR